MVVLCKLSGGGGGGGGGQVEDLVGVVGVDYVGIGRFGGVAASVVASGGRVDSGRSAGGCRGCGGRCRRLGHDFLADLADLQLQARFRGEDLRVQRLQRQKQCGCEQTGMRMCADVFSKLSLDTKIVLILLIISD